MIKDKTYFLEVGEAGAERLGVLNELTNNSSQNFLLEMGLKPGMKIMELGCGTGQMTIWLAKYVQPTGTVIAIDNSSEQINIARQLAQKEEVRNIEFYVASAYEIDALGMNGMIDMFFARYVFIHLVDHEPVLKKVKNLLKPETGIVVIQDGIISHLFSYPEIPAVNQLFDLTLKLYQYCNKDPDIGKKLIKLYKNVGLKVLDYEYHHPLLKTEREKIQMVRGIIESRKFVLENRLADEKMLNKLIEELTLVAKNHEVVVSFGPNMIVGGRL